MYFQELHPHLLSHCDFIYPSRQNGSQSAGIPHRNEKKIGSGTTATLRNCKRMEDCMSMFFFHLSQTNTYELLPKSLGRITNSSLIMWKLSFRVCGTNARIMN